MSEEKKNKQETAEPSAETAGEIKEEKAGKEKESKEEKSS